MKRISIYLLLLLFAIKSFAESFQINVNSELNVRSKPSTESQVIGKLQNRDVVEADIMDNGWAKLSINDKTGYVNSKYLTKAHGVTIGKSKSFWNPKLDWGDKNYKWMAYLVGGFILGIWVFCKFIRGLDANDDCFWYTSNLEGITAVLSGAIQMACSFLIFYYVWKTGQYALWFIMPSQVGGWGYAIVNFIIFLYALVNLFVGFLKTMDDIQYVCETDISLKWGAITWVIGLSAIIFCYFFKEEYIHITFMALLASQAIQVVIIGINLLSEGKFLGFLIATFVYLVGSTAIVVFVSPLLVVTCVLLVGGIIAYFVLNLDSSSSSGVTYVSSSSSNSNASSSPESPGCQQCYNCKHRNWFDNECCRTNHTFKIDPSASGCAYWEWNGKK